MTSYEQSMSLRFLQRPVWAVSLVGSILLKHSVWRLNMFWCLYWQVISSPNWLDVCPQTDVCMKHCKYSVLSEYLRGKEKPRKKHRRLGQDSNLLTSADVLTSQPPSFPDDSDLYSSKPLKSTCGVSCDPWDVSCERKSLYHTRDEMLRGMCRYVNGTSLVSLGFRKHLRFNKDVTWSERSTSQVVYWIRLKETIQFKLKL